MRIPKRISFCKEFCLPWACSFAENEFLHKCCYGRHYLDFSYLSCCCCSSFFFVDNFRNSCKLYPVAASEMLISWWINFNEVSRQPFEIVDIMRMSKAAILRCSAKCLFWKATLSLEIFLEEVFILNLSLE